VFRPDPDHECAQCGRILKQDNAPHGARENSVPAEVFNLLTRRPSRREFLKSAAIVSGARSLAAQSARSPLVYVGTCSSPQGQEGSKGYGEGIYLFEMDPATG
jgi:hypothetical protein